MKTNLLNFRMLTVIIAVTLAFTACKKDDEVDNSLTDDNAKKSAQVEMSNDEVDAVVEEAYTYDQGISGKTLGDFTFTGCPERSVSVTGNVRTITLDFGTGCTRPNGNVLSGIITIVYTHVQGSATDNLTYTYNNFTFNGIALSGGGTVVRVLANANGHPQSTANIDVTAVFPDGITAHRTGTRIREWTEGFGNGIWSDNVFLITGNWTTTFSNGNVNSGTVTTPLRRTMTCRYIVSGVIQLSHNDLTGTLDYGDGTCNNTAIFTGPYGVQHTIILGN